MGENELYCDKYHDKKTNDLFAIWHKLDTVSFDDVIVQVFTFEAGGFGNFFCFTFERLEDLLVELEEVERSLHEKLS